MAVRLRRDTHLLRVRPRIEVCLRGNLESGVTNKFRGEVTKTFYAPGGMCYVQCRDVRAVSLDALCDVCAGPDRRGRE